MTIDPVELEREIHRALRALPEPRAPRSLAPRVMQAIAAAAQPQAGWRQWPLEWQLLGLVVTSSLVIALTLLLPYGSAWIGNLHAARTVAAIWQTFIAPIATAVIAITAVMCTACALLVAALKHVAWEGQRTLQS